jgi:hypothetical protein
VAFPFPFGDIVSAEEDDCSFETMDISALDAPMEIRSSEWLTFRLVALPSL